MDVAERLAGLALAEGALVATPRGRVVAEWCAGKRRTPGLERQLRYRLEFSIDADARTVIVQTTLWEAGSGIDFGADLLCGAETERVGNVWEDAARTDGLRRLYPASINLDHLTHRFERACSRAGFQLRKAVRVAAGQSRV